MAPEPTPRPDPRDFESKQEYEKAMQAYLDDLHAETGFTSPFDALRNWRESPPGDGWQ